MAAHQDRQKIQRVLDDAEGNLARQTTPQQQGEAMLLEASKQCREVEVVLNDLDRRGGACAGLRARTQTVKQRLHEQEFRPRTRRNGNELAEMDALDKEMSQLRDQVFRLRDARRAVEEVYQKNQQHVEQELTWITAAEVKGYILDRTRPVMGEALDWLGKLKQLLTTEDLDALIQLDAIDQEIGGRITDIRTLGATFSQHRYEYEQLRRDMKTPRVDEICQQAVSVADELDSVHEHYRQWLQPDALRRLANTVREAWSGLGSEMAQPRESRLEYLAGRLRHAKGSLDQLAKLQKEARQNLAGRHKEQTEVRSKYDELDAMLGAWRARGADQDDGMVSDFARWSAQRESLRLTLDQPAANYAETNTLAEGVVNEARARFSAYTDEYERVKADLKALEAQLKADRQVLWDLNQHSLVNFEERVTQFSSRVDTWLHRYDDGMRHKRPLTAVRELLADGQNLDGDIRGVRAEIEREDALLKASRDRADEKWQEAQLAWLEFRQNALGGREWDSERWYAGDLAQLRASLDAAGRQLVELVAPLKRRAPADLHGGFDQIEQALVRARDLANRQAIKAGREIGELRTHKERLETAVDWYGRQASRQPNLMSQWTAKRQDVMEALQLSCRAARQAGDVSAALILALEQVNEFGRRAGIYAAGAIAARRAPTSGAPATTRTTPDCCTSPSTSRDRPAGIP